MSLADLTQSLSLPKSTIYAVCQTLTSDRLLSQGADGSYRLGPAVIELAATRRARSPLVRRIGMSVPNASNAFFEAEIRAAREEATIFGASVEAVAAHQDVTRQSQQITDFVLAGVDLIVIDPVSSSGLEGALSRASEERIPTVSINGATFGADASVVTDNAQAGTLAARYLVERLDGVGDVALVGGTSVTAIADRLDGFRQTLAVASGVRLVSEEPGDNSRDAGRAAARRILSAHPEIAGIFAINDLTALGVLDVCEESDVSPVVVGVDGSREAVERILSGGPLSASAAQDPEQLARTAVRLAVDLVSGTGIRGRTLLLPTRLITSASAPNYEPWG